MNRCVDSFLDTVHFLLHQNYPSEQPLRSKGRRT